MARSSAIDPKQRFSSRVDAYVTARPRYPRAVIDHLRSAIGLAPDWRVVDVGSGTGISCELFIENGNPVVGVEPNDAMRAAAQKSLGTFRNFRSVNGSAEATGLPESCADLIVAAQAFHWFDRAATRAECLRLLRPGGWVLIMWNNRQLDSSPFLKDYERLLLDFSIDYQMVKHRHVSIETPEFAAFFGHSHYQRVEFPNVQHLDLDGLRARLLSSSYVPQPGDEHHEPMLEQLREIFARHNQDGLVSMEYQTELFYGRPTLQSMDANADDP